MDAKGTRGAPHRSACARHPGAASDHHLAMAAGRVAVAARSNAPCAVRELLRVMDATTMSRSGPLALLGIVIL
jgi:hypothetical protein